MDIQKEEKFEALPEIEMMLRENPDIKFENGGYVYHGLNQLTALAVCYVAGAWMAWKEAKAQAMPEGFVLVPKDKISHFYQDNDEPENFCNSSNDWDCLGDGIDKDQIMIVNKHTQANISTEKFYGAWKLIETPYGTRWKFELFKSESEAKQAMIEAQEPAND
ncbi:hypothetical protein [Acinetobacter lwoffii]|uniref:hypothetical protein n=1 Tax=Acinetobacter lwoffii TaxID=28090 RepID=UPI00220226D5|nr:hypothetical protein ABWED_1748 [Acinetobacter lwoffii]